MEYESNRLLFAIDLLSLPKSILGMSAQKCLDLQVATNDLPGSANDVPIISSLKVSVKSPILPKI